MCDTREGIVELKNPYTARDMSIQEAVKKPKDCCWKCDKDSLISLHTSHNYYYQVQATMLLRETGVISSYVPKRHPHNIERIPYDQELMSSVLPKLEQFYFEAILHVRNLQEKFVNLSNRHHNFLPALKQNIVFLSKSPSLER